MNNKEEMIGCVRLDYSLYSGKDSYTDGSIEDELLNLVQQYDCSQYMDYICKKNSWPLYYHLSLERHNILQWYEMKENASVLEIGSGCGAITGCLLQKSLKVTCVELSKKRSLINAYRNRNFDFQIFVANFKEYSKVYFDKKFDYITLIGVFEYSELYMQGEKNAQKYFLNRVKQHLKDDGKLIIAIENKFGLKYWAGCKEDHTERYFEGIEGYKNSSKVKTFSKQEWMNMLIESDFKNVMFYYPYPDYKFPTSIYSDSFLPKTGDLKSNNLNYDSERCVLFEETRVFDELIDSNLFTTFSNSFLIIAERGNRCVKK